MGRRSCRNTLGAVQGGITEPREPLHERVRRLVHRRWGRVVGAIGAFLAAALLSPLLSGLGPDASHAIGSLQWWSDVLGSAFLFGAPAVLLLGVVYALRASGQRSAKSGEWEWERLATLAEQPGANPSTFPKVDRTQYPTLSSAVDMYQAATGRVDPLQLARLARSTYATRIDACVRLDEEPPVIYFTQSMLESFSATQLLGVIAHVLERYRLMRSGFQSVMEADSRALLITRDPASILDAIAAAQTGRVPALARVANREAWFSDDECEPDPYDDTAPPHRIDRDRELRKHLGPLGLQHPDSEAHAPAHP